MGNPLECQIWFGSNGETHVKSHKGDLTMIFKFAAKVYEATYTCTKRVVKLDGMQGLFAIPTQERKIQQRKGRLRKPLQK